MVYGLMTSFILLAFLASCVQGVCPCKYEGTRLDLTGTSYSNETLYPTARLYGTTCAAWDMVPGTPWHAGSCASADNPGGWCNQSSNWCQIPWCYVDSATCDEESYDTDVFTTLDLKYSYAACGNPNCYGDAWSDANCPWNSDRGCKEAADTSGDCDCLYKGTTLPDSLINDSSTTYDVDYTSYYGTTCAAWDTIPSTPFHDGYCNCDLNNDSFCNATRVDGYGINCGNWCHNQWCYVSSDCGTKASTTVFAPATLYYSYYACGDPNCYSATESACPFDEFCALECDVCSDDCSKTETSTECATDTAGKATCTISAAAVSAAAVISYTTA